MKASFVLLLLLPLLAGAQKYFLLDRNLQAPFVPADTITLHQVASGAFPIYTADLQDLIHHLQSFAGYLSAAPAGAPLPQTLRSLHSKLILTRKKKSYRCVLQTSSAVMAVPLFVASGGRKEALRGLTRFMDYLRHNRAVLIPNAAVRR